MKRKKLVLSKETLAGLTRENLEAAHGGASLAASFCCSMTCYPCGEATGTRCAISLCICQ